MEFVVNNSPSLQIFIDGACRGNPGTGGAGIIYIFNGKILKEKYKYLGHTTNNQTEYLALLTALKDAYKMGYKNLSVYTDSELLYNQINGIYLVRNIDLKKLFDKAKKEIAKFALFQINRIDRKENKRADALANLAIEEYLKKDVN